MDLKRSRTGVGRALQARGGFRRIAPCMRRPTAPGVMPGGNLDTNNCGNCRDAGLPAQVMNMRFIPVLQSVFDLLDSKQARFVLAYHLNKSLLPQVSSTRRWLISVASCPYWGRTVADQTGPMAVLRRPIPAAC
jgi:hypothetical protein